MSNVLQIRSRSEFSSPQKVRTAGFVPAILYGRNKENVQLAVDKKDLKKALDKSGFMTEVFILSIGNVSYEVLPKAIHFHSVSSEPLHVDFMYVQRGSTVKVRVPIKCFNHEKSPAIKRGGILNMVVHDILISCLVENVPKCLLVDLDGYEAHNSARVRDLTLPEGASAKLPADTTIVTIIAPKAKN